MEALTAAAGFEPTAEPDRSTAGLGPKVGTPAPLGLVGCYFAAALASWIAATLVLALAAPDLAAADVAAPRVLLSVHLVALGFLPLAVTGAAELSP